MKINFVMPNYSQSPSLPYGLYALKTFLSPTHSVQVTDCNIEPLHIGSEDIVGVYVSTFVFGEAVDIIKQAKAKGKIVIAGGPHAWSDSQSLINAGADYVVVGDGEYATAHILDCIESGTPCDRVVSIPIDNLDDLPITVQPHGKYANDSVPVLSARGCPYSCTYCTKHMPGYRMRSVDHFMRELDMHDGNKISLIDDLFTVNEKRLEQIAHKARSLDIELILGNGTRVDALHGTRMQSLRKLNTVQINVGVESLYNDTLHAVNKKITCHDIKRALAVLDKSRIKHDLFMIIGLPFDTLERTKASAKWIKKQKIHAHWNVATPYPNTQFHKWVSENAQWLIDPEDYTQYSGHYTRANPVFDTPDFTSTDRLKALSFANKTCGVQPPSKTLYNIYSRMPNIIKPILKQTWEMIK